MIRTQISFGRELYAKAKVVARRQGISVAELCRRGIEQIIARQPTDKPWMKYSGVVEGEAGDSSTVDAVVYDRDRP